MQAPAAMSATDNALQQRGAFSHRSSRLVWHRFGVGVEPRLVGFKGGPIDKTGMMVAEENGPLLGGQMPHPLPDRALRIDISFAASFTVGVSASIHRIGEDLVESMVGGSHPADRPR